MSNIKNVDLNLLIALDVLMDEKSVSRAAERLHLTQPTVSGMLARLRVIYNDPLFVRAQRGMVPTPACERLRPTVKQWVLSTRRIIAPLEFDPFNTRIKITIAASDYVQLALIKPLINKLRQSAPKIIVATVPMTHENLEEKLLNGDIDIAISYQEMIPSGLLSQKLCSDSYVGALRAQHPFKGKTLSIKQFCELQHALVSPSGVSFKGPMDKALAKIDHVRNVVLSVPNFASLESLLEAEDLIAVVPKRFLKLSRSNLRSIKLPVPIDGFHITAAWHPRTDADVYHRWMRDILIAVAKKYS